MSHHLRTVILLIIVIILVILGWLWYGSSNNQNKVMPGNNQVAMDQNNTSQNQAVVVSPDVGLTTSPSDTSDAAIQADLASVDSQLNNMKTDTSGIDQSLPQ